MPINYLDDLQPELLESSYLMRRYEKKAQRIRHTKYGFSVILWP